MQMFAGRATPDKKRKASKDDVGESQSPTASAKSGKPSPQTKELAISNRTGMPIAPFEKAIPLPVSFDGRKAAAQPSVVKACCSMTGASPEKISTEPVSRSS